MSRIGKKPIIVPDKVKVTVENNLLKATGPKGELTHNLPGDIQPVFENSTLTFTRPNDEKLTRSIHGLTRSLVANIVEGVSNGFSKIMQIEGVGYKAEMKGKRLMLSLGYSHQILIIPPDEVTIESPTPNLIKINGIDKQLVGAVAARIRKLRPPEPYKGKGIRYQNEFVRRKAGKTTSK